jgi:hypothetical protein
MDKNWGSYHVGAYVAGFVSRDCEPNSFLQVNDSTASASISPSFGSAISLLFTNFTTEGWECM